MFGTYSNTNVAAYLTSQHYITNAYVTWSNISSKPNLAVVATSGNYLDLTNTPNDWVAIASHYLLQDVCRKKVVPNRAHFHDSLVKAAAVIVAALEYEQNMTSKGQLTD